MYISIVCFAPLNGHVILGACYKEMLLVELVKTVEIGVKYCHFLEVGEVGVKNCYFLELDITILCTSKLQQGWSTSMAST